MQGYHCVFGEVEGMPHKAGSAILSGDLVAIASDDHRVDSVAAAGEACYGMAAGSQATVGANVTVVPAYPGVLFRMKLRSQVTVDPTTETLLGNRFAVHGTAGAQTIDLNDSGTDAKHILKLHRIVRDEALDAYVALVSIYYTANQALAAVG